MKRITTFITGASEFILASTQPEDAFAKLAPFIAIDAKDVTDGATNRKLTGLDIVTGDSLPELMKNCERSAKARAFFKAHPMPEKDSPDFQTWLENDFKAYTEIFN